ncbi:MAG: hypothetical protein OSA81_09960 [Longimicrobiales bacterium]|nr:hypothetical protein [Longimicrobiales bacterium]
MDRSCTYKSSEISNAWTSLPGSAAIEAALPPSSHHIDALDWKKALMQNGLTEAINLDDDPKCATGPL